MDALKQAHIASDEYSASDDYSLANAVAWNTRFEFPQSAVDEDHQLWQECCHDFTLLCKVKQGRLAANRLSVQRVKHTFFTERFLIAFGICGEWHHSNYWI